MLHIPKRRYHIPGQECFTTQTINMKSLTCLIRPRRAQAPSLEQAQQSHQLQAPDKGGNGKKAVDLRPANPDKKQGDGDDSKTPQSSSQFDIAELRQSIGNAQDALSQILNNLSCRTNRRGARGELQLRLRGAIRPQGHVHLDLHRPPPRGPPNQRPSTAHDPRQETLGSGE